MTNRRKDAFSRYHPLVGFLYFALVIGITMFYMHPAIQLISLVGAFAYAIRISGAKAVRAGFLYLLPLALLATGINVAFNHQGATVLTFLPSGNPVTAESLAGALGSAVTVVSAVAWFSSFASVMTTDKFVYLFGRVIPALSLLLSMTLRFIPMYRERYREVADVQKTLHGQGGAWQKVRLAVNTVSIVTTWALENALETADSMKSRGYGRPGRTAFSIYPFYSRDRYAIAFMALFFVGFAGLVAQGGVFWRYYPTMKMAPLTPISVYHLAMFAVLCGLPLIIHSWEDRSWRQ